MSDLTPRERKKRKTSVYELCREMIKAKYPSQQSNLPEETNSVSNQINFCENPVNNQFNVLELNKKETQTFEHTINNCNMNENLNPSQLLQQYKQVQNNMINFDRVSLTQQQMYIRQPPIVPTFYVRSMEPMYYFLPNQPPVEQNLTLKNYTDLDVLKYGVAINKTYSNFQQPNANSVQIYTCSICNIHFKEEKYLSLHNVHQHSNKDVINKGITECEQSKVLIKAKNSVHADSPKMEIYKPYSCSICGNQFKNKKALTTHNRFHHKENTQSVKKTIKNMLAENIKMKDPCSTCQELQVKMLIKNKCFICGGKFKSKGELMLHIESNHHEKNYYGVNLHEKETELLQRNDETKVYNNDSRQSDVRTALKVACPVYNDELNIKHKMSKILHKEKADLSKPTNINKVTENKLLNEKDETETNCSNFQELDLKTIIKNKCLKSILSKKQKEIILLVDAHHKDKSDSSNVGLHVKNIPSQLKSRKSETNAQSPTVLRFTCSICGIQFKEKKQLFLHFEDFHKEKEDSIELPMDSAEVIKSEVSEKIHLQNNCTNCESPEMRTDDKYKCTVCGIQYHTKKEMLMHYEYHRKGEHYKNLAPILKCSKKCDKSLTKSETSSIYSKDNAEGVYFCQSCKRVYYSPARFVKHCCKPKKEGKQNVWDACKKVLAEKFPQQVTYRSPENLLPKLPISKIFPQLEMKVEDITKVCKTEDASDDVHLQMNSNFENSESSQESSSGIYGKNSGDSNDLDFQINSKNEVLNSVETKDSDLSCANCDLVFTDIEKYELHRDTHSNDEFCCLKEGKEKLHVCDKCGKCFTELTVFQSHYLTHNNNNNNSNNKPEIKPFVCGVCLTCFTNFGDIQSHHCVYSSKESLKASKKEKSLICNICGSHFTDLEIFQLHCETHTEDESHNTKHLDDTYVCEACDIQFTDVEEFETHCLNHTNKESDYINSVEEKPYICHICGACFIIFNEFEKHCSIHI